MAVVRLATEMANTLLLGTNMQAETHIVDCKFLMIFPSIIVEMGIHCIRLKSIPYSFVVEETVAQ